MRLADHFHVEHECKTGRGTQTPCCRTMRPYGRFSALDIIPDDVSEPDVTEIEETLFDSLPPDAIPNILRLFSERPFAENWKSYVRIKDVWRLYCAEGDLAEACRQLFTKITCRYFRRHCVAADDCLNVGLRFADVERILRAGAPYLTEMDWSLFSFTPEQISALRKRCPNLKALGVSFAFLGEPSPDEYKPLFQSVLGQLSSLVGGGRPAASVLDAIAQHCKRLVKLEIEEPEHDMDSFFAARGPGLEHLGLAGEIRSLEILASVKKHCRNLVSLKLGAVEDDVKVRDAVVDLVVSYSTSLEKLFIGSPLSLTRSQYLEIARRCPIVRCSISCDWEDVVQHLNGLGDRLEVLNVTSGDVYPEEEALLVAARKFSKLREINWDDKLDGDFNSLHSFLSVVKCSLRVLKVETALREEWTANDCARIFQFVAEECNYVEVVEVLFEFIGTPQIDVDDFTNLVASFALCESLNELYINTATDNSEGINFAPVVRKIFHVAFKDSKIRFANVFGQKYFRFARYA